MKLSKAKQKEFEDGWKQRNKFLKSLGLGKEPFEKYMEWLHGKGRKEKRQAQYKPEPTPPIQRLSEKSTPSNYGINDMSLRSEGMGRKNDLRSTRSALYPSVSNDGCVKPTILYTGTKMVGIAQMSKSNAVPVFSNEEILDIARMRR